MIDNRRKLHWIQYTKKYDYKFILIVSRFYEAIIILWYMAATVTDNPIDA